MSGTAAAECADRVDNAAERARRIDAHADVGLQHDVLGVLADRDPPQVDAGGQARGERQVAGSVAVIDDRADARKSKLACAAATPRPDTTTGTKRSMSIARQVAQATATSPDWVFTATIDRFASALDAHTAANANAVRAREGIES